MISCISVADLAWFGIVKIEVSISLFSYTFCLMLIFLLIGEMNIAKVNTSEFNDTSKSQNETNRMDHITYAKNVNYKKI